MSQDCSIPVLELVMVVQEVPLPQDHPLSTDLQLMTIQLRYYHPQMTLLEEAVEAAAPQEWSITLGSVWIRPVNMHSG